ncbi:hypothetical protein M8C21_029595 [Ambrosia artemisiifolia]|uniref:Uncharacterized protein n=1 Tax=Ambrosia artemisiifolia TaxID=4212 RepID=A0AAD5CIU0_AMBAR|nr:hypothetical protein M8C21_029595 [Ambrosia artemisiifolia]
MQDLGFLNDTRSMNLSQSNTRSTGFDLLSRICKNGYNRGEKQNGYNRGKN